MRAAILYRHNLTFRRSEKNESFANYGARSRLQMADILGPGYNVPRVPHKHGVLLLSRSE
jgi:hypothetical protein